MPTCKVEAEIFVRGERVAYRTWPECDIMKTSVTRGWATKEFNKWYAVAKPDDIVRVTWSASRPGHITHNGVKSRVVGRAYTYKSGVFDD